MKRTLAFLMTALFLTMLLIGCGTTTTEAGKTTLLPTSPSGENTVPTDTAGTTSETQGETVEFKGEDVRLALLTGSTGLGASKLISDSKKNETVNRYTIDLTGDPTEVIAGLKTGKYDLAALPVNVAAKLYNMPDVEVQVVALNTLGVLYVLENETETVQSVADLKGKTIYTTGEGATPQYILEYLLKENGLKAGEDVTVVYRATADEVQADIQQAGAVAMLPEPKATVVTKAITTVRYALDITAEWDKISSTKVTQGCVVATKDFATGHKAALDAFLQEYKASVEFINTADDAAAEAVVEAGIIGKAPIAKIAIPKSNLVCYEGEEMKGTLSAMLQVLFDLDAKSVGGAMPGDDFYYEK